MITFIKEWANQIIVAVIIATIFEMFLPNGNNKKYIKIVIGIYVLFTIIQPIITKITGNTLEISDFNYEKYFDKDILETSSQDFENNNSKLIKQAYIDNIKSDIKAKVNQKGYEVISCNIDIIEDENQETYGTIQSISLKIEEIKELEKEVTNTIEIQNIDISANNSSDKTNSTNNTEKYNILNKEKTEIIEYLKNEYSIDNIIIN